jgi:hypothetical protein
MSSNSNEKTLEILQLYFGCYNDNASLIYRQICLEWKHAAQSLD